MSSPEYPFQLTVDQYNPIHSETTADVLYLRYHLGYEHAEVAEELNMSEEGARQVAIQGLKRVKELVYGE